MTKQDLAISFSEEQAMLLEIAERFARERSDFAAVRDRMAASEPVDQALWDEIVAMGWPGLIVPEEFGGSELSIDTHVPVVEACGRNLLSVPLVPTALATQLILQCGSEDQKARWLPRIVEGSVASVAVFEPGGSWALNEPALLATRTGDQVTLSGTKVQVLDAAVAEILIVNAQLDGEPALILLERETFAPHISLHTTVDETRRAYKIDFDDLRIPQDAVLAAGDASAALTALARSGELLLSAEMAGGLAGALALTLDYIKTREAFGSPIGRFQSLKHAAAEILLSLEAARTLVYHAATLLVAAPESKEAEIATRMAKAHVSDAFLHAGDRAVQFHGGMGFTYECNAQLFLRRALWSQPMFGDGRYHREQLAMLLLD